MLGTEPDQARKELEAIASRLRADKEEPPLERAKAAYALKDYVQAETLALEAAHLAAQHTPPDAPEQIAALNLAGESARAQIHYLQALEHYRAATALTSKERDVLQWLDLQNAISWLYYLQGRYPEGLAHTQQVWQTAQQADKDDAPAVLIAHMLYASALDDNDQAAAAEPEYRAVIQVQERVLGADHPDTLKSRNNLATGLRVQGKNDEAEQEHRAVLKIRERVLGAEHPDILANRNNLGTTLQAQGKSAEAEQEHRAVLKVQERVLGAEHPSAATSCYNLALCLEAQQKLPEALGFMQRAEQVWTKVLGPDHPHTKLAKADRERIEAAVK
jgi:tetratricopeptide (TPR) repeat protein